LGCKQKENNTAIANKEYKAAEIMSTMIIYDPDTFLYA
jgi:hypothetical protein